MAECRNEMGHMAPLNCSAIKCCMSLLGQSVCVQYNERIR